jgi:hypothetical protein
MSFFDVRQIFVKSALRKAENYPLKIVGFALKNLKGGNFGSKYGQKI